MQQIVECVPNFSEGRRPEVYNAIADVIRGVPAAHVLDVSADPDHNRCVITFVGTPSAVEEAAYLAIAEAAKHISLEEHEGEHPRIGATDVCPFIPVKNVSIDECIALANRLGQRVGADLDIAVYLYGAAAKIPERVKLADIRRGQYERWRREVASDPKRKPDFGPAEPKHWGATVIGVRPFLIAYNIFINTDNVDMAKRIAKAVRYSSGGLRHVQAMGFLVEGQAQVSMNLTDFTKTPLHRVQEMVRREASRYGLSITHAELIGLAPQKALFDAAKWYLQADDIQEDQILENRLLQESEHDFTPYGILERLADGTPTPGGGSAAALAGALGAALVEMVSHLTVGRQKYAHFQDEAEQLLVEAKQLRSDLTVCISADADAFDHVMAAWRNKALSPKEKEEQIELATIRAGEVPMSAARLSNRVAKISFQMVESGNKNAITDAAAGGLLAKAAVQIASLNVRINAKELKDKQLALRWLRELEEIEGEVKDITEKTIRLTVERGGI
jgi:glutamate formiminotransferase/formiminotetrahydrofolate cyclodeaminase